jgi:hypothetical protein
MIPQKCEQKPPGPRGIVPNPIPPGGARQLTEPLPVCVRVAIDEFR